jgi:hypothetical protein
MGTSSDGVGGSSALRVCRSFFGVVWSRLVRFLLGLAWSRMGMVSLAMGRRFGRGLGSRFGCGLGLAPFLVGMEQLVGAVTAAA